jgi:hypothetical protein
MPAWVIPDPYHRYGTGVPHIIRDEGYVSQAPTRGPSLVASFLLTRRAEQLKVPIFPDGDLQDVDDAASEVLV